MTNLNKMYDGVANSPDTFLTSPLASGGNIMYVADSSVFGTLPNLAVLGSEANAETVLIISKRSDQGLNIQRAVEGVARDWAKASIVARNFTNYDYKILKENIELLNSDKVGKVTGKGLSSNDYTNAEKNKLVNIEDEANKVTKLSELENDKNFKTEEEVIKLINDSNKLKILTLDEYNNLNPKDEETAYVIK